MSYFGILKGVRDSGANKNPKFNFFYGFFKLFSALFIIIGAIVSKTNFLEKSLLPDKYFDVILWGGMVLIIILIILAVLYLKNSNQKTDLQTGEKVDVVSSPKGLGALKGWKAVGLFSAFVIFGIIVAILTPQN